MILTLYLIDMMWSIANSRFRYSYYGWVMFSYLQQVFKWVNYPIDLSRLMMCAAPWLAVWGSHHLLLFQIILRRVLTLRLIIGTIAHQVLSEFSSRRYFFLVFVCKLPRGIRLLFMLICEFPRGIELIFVLVSYLAHIIYLWPCSITIPIYHLNFSYFCPICE